MYIGRLVALGATTTGKPAIAYRVSSRSFPNRQAVLNQNNIAIVPKPGHEKDIILNPYIAYTGLEVAKEYAIASNGAHTTIIANKLRDGCCSRDALAQTLIAMDYEHDELDTPRIAAIVDPRKNQGYLGVVSKDSFHIQPFSLEAGRLYYLSTYGLNTPSCEQFCGGFYADSAGDVCQHILLGENFYSFTNPVLSAAAIWTGVDWRTDMINLANSEMNTPHD